MGESWFFLDLFLFKLNLLKGIEKEVSMLCMLFVYCLCLMGGNFINWVFEYKLDYLDWCYY